MVSSADVLTTLLPQSASVVPGVSECKKEGIHPYVSNRSAPSRPCLFPGEHPARACLKVTLTALLLPQVVTLVLTHPVGGPPAEQGKKYLWGLCLEVDFVPLDLI